MVHWWVVITFHKCFFGGEKRKLTRFFTIQLIKVVSNYLISFGSGYSQEETIFFVFLASVDVPVEFVFVLRRGFIFFVPWNVFDIVSCKSRLNQ